MVTILTYSLSNHLSGRGTAELISSMAAILPQPNNLQKSSFLFKKYFEDHDSDLLVYYFCSNCWRPRNSFQDICDKCTAPKRKVSYYIQCPLQPQIKKLLKRPGFLQKLKYKHLRKKINDENIEDIYDGTVYKEAEETILKNDENNDDQNISATIYSDGVSIYECSIFSLWLCMLTINELPPEERHRPENVLITGLWGGDGKPHPNIYQLSTYHDIDKANKGFRVQPHGFSDDVKVSLFVLFCTCDSPARANFMCMKGRSGYYYSCSKCFIKGEKSERTKYVMVFPHEEKLSSRNAVNFNECTKLAVNKKDGHQGVYGPTLLSYILSSSIIDGMCIDAMHAVYMGVLKQFLKLWFDVKYKTYPFSLVEKIPEVNDRLNCLNLPHFVERLPIEVDKCVSFMKATLLRNLLFYIFLVVLKDLQPTLYYDHFSKLVSGVALLNSCSISNSDLDEADSLLQYNEEKEKLYGIRFMSSNDHSLRHLAQCVKASGPLFMTSCFGYEDLNGLLAALAHGTHHAIMQIATRLEFVRDLPLLIKSVRSETAADICDKLTHRSRYFSLSTKICEKLYIVGQLSGTSDYSGAVYKLLNVMYGKPTKFSFFDRIFKNGVLYVSSLCTRGSRISSFCKYRCGKVVYHGTILTFIKLTLTSDVKCFALLERSLDLPVGIDRHFEYVASSNSDLINVTELLSVSFCSSVNGHQYIVDLLNTFELE